MPTSQSLAISAIFKDEDHLMHEWLSHYALQGATSFYLYDDGSTDRSREIIKKFIVSNPAIQIKIFDVPKDLGYGSQLWYLENFSPIARGCIKEDWLLVCDIDEFTYCRTTLNVSITEALSKFAQDKLSAIYVPWLAFGSNGIATHPPSAKEAYTKRINFDGVIEWHADNRNHFYGSTAMKYFVRPLRVHKLGIHRVDLASGLSVRSCYPESSPNRLTEDTVDQFHLVMNHYQFQSLEFWREKKMVRGCSSGWNAGEYSKTMQTFEIGNLYANQIDDFFLRDQVLDKDI